MSSDSPTIANDLAYCATITRGGGSNLWFVSKLLPEAKKPLFIASYASMRFIDDLVDDDFLALPKEERAEQRDRFLMAIADWEAKATGECVPTEKQSDAIHRALSQTVHRSSLGPKPWHELAKAMRRDVMETPIHDWSDFEQYSVGATVSPAVVYLYILLCRQTAGGRFEGPTAEQLYSQAHDVAIFCYLVHIMRDLAKDAAGCAQLLTIPYELRDRLLAGSISGAALIAEVAAKAEQHNQRMTTQVENLSAQMNFAERQAFTALLKIYRRLFENIRQDPDCVFHADPQNLDHLCRETNGQ